MIFSSLFLAVAIASGSSEFPTTGLSGAELGQSFCPERTSQESLELTDSSKGVPTLAGESTPPPSEINPELPHE